MGRSGAFQFENDWIRAEFTIISAINSEGEGSGSSAQCLQIGRLSSMATAGRSPQKAQLIRLSLRREALEDCFYSWRPRSAPLPQPCGIGRPACHLHTRSAELSSPRAKSSHHDPNPRHHGNGQRQSLQRGQQLSTQQYPVAGLAELEQEISGVSHGRTLQ